MSNKDPFLHELYDKLNETPMQLKLQERAPMPVGAVFLPWPGMTEDDMRHHFRTMRDLGYTCLKQTMPCPEWSEEKILLTAIDENIYPFWYAEAGNPDGSDEENVIPEQIKETLRERVKRKVREKQEAKKPEVRSRKKAQMVPGVVGDIKGHELHEKAIPHFIDWLKTKYDSPLAVAKAWNAEHVGISNRALDWKNWQDLEENFLMDIPEREYRHLRDIMRFRADTFNKEWIEEPMRKQLQEDEDDIFRAGGEMGLFIPFASRGTDMEGMAELMAEGGSFYPSIHMAWHFEEVDFEVARPVYMQAQITTDWAKGVWTATWESTGGPQYFSGGKAPFVESAQNKVPGFTIDENTITQLMLSYLAAEFKGFGLWCWNARTAGWEAGEFALLDRNNEVTPRAIQAGKIGQTARKYRRELWQAHKEPLVGILVDWENEAMCAALSVPGRDRFKSDPIRARIGASRAMINQNIPWEYVTPKNIFKGLAPRYQAIYLPYALSIRDELLKALTDYVKAGGRLIMDMPGAYLDEYGRMIDTSQGSNFEKLFGAVLNEYEYSSKNTPLEISGVPFDGFAARLTPTTAETIACYNNDKPGITENSLGKGKAVILGAQASLNCLLPGNEKMEDLIRRTTLNDAPLPYNCDGALVYRLASPQADHYFLINDAEAKNVKLKFNEYKYKKISDALSSTTINLDSGIDLPAYSGRWLRAEKG